MSEAQQPQQSETDEHKFDPEKLKDMSVKEIANALSEQDLDDETIAAYFQDLENVTYKGEKYRISVIPGGRVELRPTSDEYKGPDLIGIKNPRDLAKLVNENLIALGIKEESVPTRLKKWAKSVGEMAQKQGRLTLDGLSKAFHSGVDQAQTKINELIEPHDYTADVPDSIGNLAGNLEEAGKEEQRAKWRAAYQRRKEKNQPTPVNPDDLEYPELAMADEETRQQWEQAEQSDLPGEVLLQQRLAEADGAEPSAEELNIDESQTNGISVADVKKGIQEWWRSSKLGKAAGENWAKLANRFKKKDNGEQPQQSNEPEQPAQEQAPNTEDEEPIINPRLKVISPDDSAHEKFIKESFNRGVKTREVWDKITHAFSWEHRVETMEAFRDSIESQLKIHRFTKETLDKYFLQYVQGFPEDEDPAKKVRKIAALLLNGRIGMTDKVEKYRGEFANMGIKLKDIGDYMEFSYEKHLRELGSQKENGKFLEGTGTQRLWSAKAFRFLQNMSPLSVRLNANGERQTGNKSMRVELQAIRERIDKLQVRLDKLKAKEGDENNELIERLNNELTSLRVAEKEFNPGRFSKARLSTFFTKDGRTVGWYAGYASGLILPHGLSRMLKLGITGLTYGVNATNELAHRYLQANGLLEGNKLTDEAAESFSNKALFATVNWATSRVVNNDQLTGFVRGAAGGAMLSTMMDIFGVNDSLDKMFHHGDAQGADNNLPDNSGNGADSTTDNTPTKAAPEGNTPTHSPNQPGNQPGTELPGPLDNAPTPGPEQLSLPQNNDWIGYFIKQTGSEQDGYLKLLAERVTNGEFNLGNNINDISPEVMDKLHNGMQEAIRIYNEAKTLNALTPLQRLLLTPLTGDSDQVALALLNNDPGAIEVSRIGSGGTIDWAEAMKELKDIIQQ